MNAQIRSYLSVFAVLATVVMPHTALARGSSAILGIPATPADAHCWSHSVGAVTNTCSGSDTKRWCMPAVVERYGSFSGVVYAKAVSNESKLACHSVGVAKDGSPYSVSPDASVASPGSFQPINLDAVEVPIFGTLYVCCDVSQGDVITNYHYW